MKYLIYGKEDYLVNNKVNSLIKEYNKDNIYEIVKFNLEVDAIEEVTLSNDSLSLFSNKKIIVLSNVESIFLSKTSKMKLTMFLEMIQKDTTNVLIISSFEQLDKAKLKKFKDFEMFNYSKLKDNELINYIERIVKNNYCTMNRMVINKFISMTTSNLYIINNELDKLFLASSNNIISEELINDTVCNYNSVDVFELVNLIVAKNKILALKMLGELMDNSSEVLGLITLIANQVKLIYQVKILSNQGLRQDEIAKSLDIHPFRVKKTLEVVHMYTESSLLKLLDELAILDIDIKSIEIDKQTRLEMFILSL